MAIDKFGYDRSKCYGLDIKTGVVKPVEAVRNGGMYSFSERN